jgi:hypothetical protein
MKQAHLIKYCLITTLLCGLSINTYATDTSPCGIPATLLALVNRPTIGDSACAVPEHKFLVEAGALYSSLNPQGYGYNLPQAVFRAGLPESNELVILIPNYFNQTVTPYSGMSASVVGIKHEVGHTSRMVGSAEALFTLPVGSYAFGSNGLGVAVNGIVNYNITDILGVTFMFGVSTQTLPTGDGGGRFTSFNPDLVLSYAPIESTSLYVEVYGQSKVAPSAGSGFNGDAGILYLVRNNVSVDVEFGQRLTGTLGGFHQYVGAGFAVMF